MKIVECQQGSPEWFQARLGVVTASEADALVSSKGKVREGLGVKTYLYQKVAEKIMGYSTEQVGSFAMDQGKIVETIAVPWFEFEHGKKVRRVGFCAADDGRSGCSPDGLLEDGSGLEIKSPQAPNHLRYLLGGQVPDEYVVQVQFSLWVTKAPHWTFVSYHIHLPPLVVRVERDDAIQSAIGQALESFLREMDAAEAKVRAMKT